MSVGKVKVAIYGNNLLIEQLAFSSTVMSSTADEPDDVQLLLLHCGEILKEARFVLSSIPNVEEETVERILRKMQSVHEILEILEYADGTDCVDWGM